MTAVLWRVLNDIDLKKKIPLDSIESHRELAKGKFTKFKYRLREEITNGLNAIAYGYKSEESKTDDDN